MNLSEASERYLVHLCCIAYVHLLYFTDNSKLWNCFVCRFSVIFKPCLLGYSRMSHVSSQNTTLFSNVSCIFEQEKVLCELKNLANTWKEGQVVKK